MLLWVMGMVFKKTCTKLEKGNVSRVVPRLYGWIYNFFSLPSLLVELRFSSRGNPIQLVPNRFTIWGIQVRILWVANKFM